MLSEYKQKLWSSSCGQSNSFPPADEWFQACKMSKTGRSSPAAGVPAVSCCKTVTEIKQILSWIAKISAFLPAQ